MSSTKDVDEAILEQARSLLPYVRANKTHDISIKSLTEVPWFIVMVFELLTTETIPPEMKPFTCLEEQANTLQMILDTLEQTLKLPMNHITGEGLARLERRHLSDALQILSDLVKHCYPTRNTHESPRDGDKSQRGKMTLSGTLVDGNKTLVSDTPEGRGLSLSQFDGPDFEMTSFIQSCTPKLSSLSLKKGMHLQDIQCNADAHKQPSKSSKSSPVVAVRPMPKTGMSQASSTAKKVSGSRYDNAGETTVQQQWKNCVPVAHMTGDKSLQSASQSSITLLEEVYRKYERGNDENQDRFNSKSARRQIRNELSPQTHSVFERRLPSLSLLSPVKSEQKVKRLPYKTQINHKNKNVSPLKIRSHRYKPYEQLGRPCDVVPSPSKTADKIPLQRCLSSARETKNMTKPHQPHMKRRTSVNRAFCRKPSVKFFQSPTTSLLRRTGMLQKENQCLSSKPKMDAVFRNDCPSLSKSTSETKVNVGSNKGPLCRSQKQSTIKSAYKPPVQGVVKKPPQPLAKKTSNKSTQNIQITRSRIDTNRTSVSSRRQDADDTGNKQQNGKQGEISSYSSKKRCKHTSKSYETSSNNRRRTSVVSTKVRKHSTSTSPIQAFDRNSKVRRPVKKVKTDAVLSRGDVSPQTTSLCSSLKLLEEFDYVKRRLKEIKVQKREYMEAIDDLEREEVRLEYLLSHVQQQSAQALIKDRSDRVPALGAAV